MMPTIRPIMICIVNDGRYHARRTVRGSVSFIPVRLIITKREIETARFRYGERRRPACSCRQLADNISRSHHSRESISAGCRDQQAGSLCSPESFAVTRQMRYIIECFSHISNARRVGFAMIGRVCKIFAMRVKNRSLQSSIFPQPDKRFGERNWPPARNRCGVIANSCRCRRMSNPCR